jgi:hypothetical protein
MGFDGLEDRRIARVQSWSGCRGAAGAQTPGERTEVNEVEPAAIAKSIEIVTQPGLEGFALKRLQSGNAKHRVIEIPASGSILESAPGLDLVFEEVSNEFGRFAEETRGEAGDLEHLDAQTHDRTPDLIRALNGKSGILNSRVDTMRELIMV